ncbi:MAG: imidazolonepropionase [Acidobacteriota bacterium]
MDADFLLDRADYLYTCCGPAPRAGLAQREAGLIEHGSVAARQGSIVWVGPADDVHREVSLSSDARVVDGSGATVVPGFVDPHTHVIYAGDRRDELRRRLSGATYGEIVSEGGGIVRTVAATRAASEDALVEAALPRVAAMLACGTTTAEVKSGYGLETEAELRSLRAIRRLAAMQPVELVPTFMGAHEVPPEWRHDRAGYVRMVIEEMLPAVASLGLAEWCDVFCEEGVFTADESRRILEAGTRLGLKPRMHADELAFSGGATVAASVGARSADHLIFADEAGARAMAQAGVVATLLPAAAFYLKIGRFAPARMLIEHGVPVALASDVNPGGGFSPSMPFAITLASFGMHMTLEESLVAATLNAAASLDRADRVGSLEVGKQLDAVILDGTLADLVRVGTRVVRAVIKRGQVVA